MLVNIVVPTFNHGKFIAQMLEGALAQQTSFDYTILIGDDASTDDAPQIIQQYAQQFPKKIKAFLHPHNLGPTTPRELGGKNNVAFLFGQCTAKYIALCEGDDYWTDTHKLQKQIDFLEANPDYALCHHQLSVIYEDGSPTHFFNDLDQTDTTLANLLADEKWLLGTASTVFRNVPAYQNFPDWWMQTASGDLGIFILATQQGKIKYFADNMGCYRKHRGGMTMIHTPQNLVFLQNRKEMFEALLSNFDGKYHDILTKTIEKYQQIISQL